MSDIARLRNIDPEEVEKLRSKGIATTDDLWERVGADFDLGIDQVAELTGVSGDRLIELLRAQAVREAKVGRSWLQRHALDVVLITVVLLLVALALRALGLPV